MEGKRTKIDFSKHKHRIDIYKNEMNDEIRIDHFQINDSYMEYIQFINTKQVLTVTGDFGNWVFCRPFIPSEKGSVDDSYWLEKLQISSGQEFNKLDVKANQTQIEHLIKKDLEDYGYEDEELKEAKSWFKELLEKSDDELEYLHYAFKDYNIPRFLDRGLIPTYKEIPTRLLIIFDAFDEICKRIKEKPN